MSDFGTVDHYVAAVKASIYQADPDATIVDLSHQIARHDVGHASFVLKAVFRDFPKNTVHLVSVHPMNRKRYRLVALALEEHFFVGVDSGIFSLISDQMPSEIVEIEYDDVSIFPERDILASKAAQLAQGKPLKQIGKPIDAAERLLPRQPKATKKQIIGHVIRIDHFGNLLTNIEKRDFEAIHQINEHKPFLVRVGKNTFDRLQSHYMDVEPGEVHLLFNSLGQLQIGITHGHASNLLGIHHDATITIDFETS